MALARFTRYSVSNRDNEKSNKIHIKIIWAASAIRKLDLDDALRRSIERGEVALGGLDPQTHDVVARMKEGGTKIEMIVFSA